MSSSSSSSSFSKLGIIFTSLSSLLFLALLAELLFILLRRHRRRCLRQPSPPTQDDNPSTTRCLFKDLLCWKKRGRIEPAGAPATESGDTETPEHGIEVSELMKLQEMIYGSSRALFTIKEEEREEIGSSERSSMEMVAAVVLSVVVGESEKGNVDVLGMEGFETPYESPCGSPPYFTPAPSPGRMER